MSLEEATTSDAKRTTFAAQFTVINDTVFLIEQVWDITNIWDEMASSLRKKLAQRTELNSRTATKQARINTASCSDSHYNDYVNDILRINNTSTEHDNCDRNMEVINKIVKKVKRLNIYSKKED